MTREWIFRHLVFEMSGQCEVKTVNKNINTFERVRKSRFIKTKK
jgi:hypothetical protein